MTQKPPHYEPEEVVIMLKKLIKVIEQFSADLDLGEVTRAQLRIIIPIIKDAKGYTIQELADIGGVTKGLVSRAISDLEAKGLVERAKEFENQDRNIKIVLTEQGTKFTSEKLAKVRESTTKWKDKITHDEIHTFIKVLAVLTDTPTKSLENKK